MPAILIVFVLGICLGIVIGALSVRRYIERLVRSSANCHYQQFLREFKEDMSAGGDVRVLAMLRKDILRKQEMIDEQVKKPPKK